MKKSSLMASFGILVLSAVLLLPNAYANGNGFSHRGKHGEGKMELGGVFQKKVHMILENAKELGLTDEKVEALKALKLETTKTWIKQNADIEIVNLDMMAKMHATSVDLEAVNKLIDQKYELKKAEDKNLIEAIAKAKGFLTQEQLDKLHELWQSREKKKRGEADEHRRPS